MKSVARIIDSQVKCLWECLPMKSVARIIDSQVNCLWKCLPVKIVARIIESGELPLGVFAYEECG